MDVVHTASTTTTTTAPKMDDSSDAAAVHEETDAAVGEHSLENPEAGAADDRMECEADGAQGGSKRGSEGGEHNNLQEAEDERRAAPAPDENTAALMEGGEEEAAPSGKEEGAAEEGEGEEEEEEEEEESEHRPPILDGRNVPPLYRSLTAPQATHTPVGCHGAAATHHTRLFIWPHVRTSCVCVGVVVWCGSRSSSKRGC
jgi:hypothetical protein